MKDKLEPNMYVRTEHGIYKINGYINNNYTQKFTYIDNKGVSNILENDEIIKASHNIIDLIEVGDYVNGEKVIDKQYHYTDKDNYDMGEWCIFYENVALGDYQYDIKSIVTKEQLESMKYEVE